MKKVLEAKNVEYVGMQPYPVAGEDLKMRTAVLIDLDARRWNSLAERTNTRSFVRMTGRQPASYVEVRQWVKDLIDGKEKAPAGTGAHFAHAEA